MADFGVTVQGWNSKTILEIKAELEESVRAAPGFGPQMNLAPETILGQIIGIAAEREANVWDLGEDAYNSQYPSDASGTSLDGVADMTGLVRLPARKSIAENVKLFGTLATVIPIGTRFSVLNDPDSIFETTALVTLIAGTDEVQTITFSGVPTSGNFKITYDDEQTVDIAWDDLAADIQTALRNLSNTAVAGITVTGTYGAGFVITFGGEDGKQIQPLLLTPEADNTLQDGGGAVTVVVTETTPGVNQGTADCDATEIGIVNSNKRTLSVIDNPLSGLSRVLNPEAAVVGRDQETDAELRIRRKTRLQVSEAGPLEAIKNKILQLNDDPSKIPIDFILAHENITLVTDAKGIPGKAFEVTIYQAGGGDTRDQEVAQAIYDSKPGGIEAHGDISKTVADSEGFNHIIKFSKASEVDIYLILDLTIDSNFYPADGDSQVENAVIAFGNGLGVGKDVIVYPSLIGSFSDIPGITDVVVKIGIAPAPTLEDNIDIDDGTSGSVEISRWIAANITINS